MVPLSEMAAVSKADELVRTTLYIISPALANRALVEEGDRIQKQTEQQVRSRLYNPTHDHLFRPTPSPKQATPKQPQQNQTRQPQSEPAQIQQRQQEQENAKR